MKLNLYAVTLLSKYARNAFASQFDHSSHPDKERFGLINLSSTASLNPFPNLTTYSATKRYDENFTNAFRDSCYKRNIDSLIVQPGIVTTSMTSNAHIPGSSCLPEECVAGSLAQLGLLDYTYGSTCHTVVGLELQAMSRPVCH